MAHNLLGPVCPVRLTVRGKGAGECKLSEAGSFVAESGASEQRPCSPGTYSPGSGAAACTLCEEGRSVSAERATACDLASGGEYVAVRGASQIMTRTRRVSVRSSVAVVVSNFRSAKYSVLRSTRADTPQTSKLYNRRASYIGA